MTNLRIGHGYDVHRLAAGRKLVLGGVDIPYEKGLEGHSDADVLVHAVMDALLGAAGLEDIGCLFPDSSEEFRGISSLVLLERVAGELKKAERHRGEYRRHHPGPGTEAGALSGSDAPEYRRGFGH